jgi:hypothetical protein
MTTHNVRYDFVPNVSVKNDVLTLAIEPAMRMAAGVWTACVEDSLSTARINCLHHALRRLRSRWPDWVFCILAGHQALQPDNRITRHRGLWKSLVASGVDLSHGEFIVENIVAEDGGFRAFCASRFELSQVESIHSIMQQTQATIVFTTTSAALNKVPLLTKQGWAATRAKPPEEVVELVCDESGLVIDVFGEFDDREATVAAIGRREVLRDLIP